MTVKELKNELSKYPENMKINITFKSKINFYTYKREKIGQAFLPQTRPIDKVIKRKNRNYLEIINTSNQSLSI